MFDLSSLFNSYNIVFNIEKWLCGIGISFSITLLSLLFGFFIALIFVFFLNSKMKFTNYLIQGFIYITRSVPLLVQIFLLYYGCAQFEWLRESPLWEILQHPFACAIIALSLNSSAYTTIIIQNNINQIPKGEIEACQTLKLSYVTMLRKIIFPRVFLSFWSSYSNEVVMVLKSSSLASTITLMDIMGVTKQIIASSYQPFGPLLFAGAFYLILSGTLLLILNTIKKKFASPTYTQPFSSSF